MVRLLHIAGVRLDIFHSAHTAVEQHLVLQCQQRDDAILHERCISSHLAIDGALHTARNRVQQRGLACTINTINYH